MSVGAAFVLHENEVFCCFSDGNRFHAVGVMEREIDLGGIGGGKKVTRCKEEYAHEHGGDGQYGQCLFIQLFTPDNMKTDILIGF